MAVCHVRQYKISRVVMLQACCFAFASGTFHENDCKTLLGILVSGIRKRCTDVCLGFFKHVHENIIHRCVTICTIISAIAVNKCAVIILINMIDVSRIFTFLRSGAHIRFLC